MRMPLKKTPITEARRLLLEAQKAYIDRRFFVARNLYDKAMKILEGEHETDK